MKSFKSFVKGNMPFNLNEFQKRLLESLDSFVNVGYPPLYIAKAVERLGEDYEFSVSVRPSSNLKSGDLSVGGFYDAESDFLKDQMPIEIYILHSSKDSEVILDDQGIENLIRMVTETLAHETIHARQARDRNFQKPNMNESYLEGIEPQYEKAAKYLANADEIEAHAFNIAGSLLVKFGTVEEAVIFLNFPEQGILEDHHLDAYLDVFGKEHEIMNELNNMIVIFLKERYDADF